MNPLDVVGTWQLAVFEITDPGGMPKPWGANMSGLLIYTLEGTMSVAMNCDPIGDPRDFKSIYDATLFYAGTYEINGDQMIHHVQNASDPDRIGKDMVRSVGINGDRLMLEGRGEFGRAVVEWRRILPSKKLAGNL